VTGRIEGKVALITGGARGQGEAAARRFVDEGARVVLADILDDEGKRLADELGDAARYIHLDVTDEAGWVDAVAQIERELGQLDVLVNNAGILRFSSLTDLTVDALRQVLDINLIGTFLGMKTCAELLKRSAPADGTSSIINVSSVEGIRGSAYLTAYTASKFGVTGITKVAAMELGPRVRANSIHPGGVATPMLEEQGVAEASAAHIAKKVALKRQGTAEDIAHLTLFLASDESSYCTGAEFVIDGGATAHAGF
jgi:3alpha(or 20beta)-hydroxysteroid dehydrogenase